MWLQSYPWKSLRSHRGPKRDWKGKLANVLLCEKAARVNPEKCKLDKRGPIIEKNSR